MTIACASGPTPVTSQSEITLPEQLPASSVALLGVKESVTGTVPDGERWVRGATTPVAACVRSALEREPALRGELTLHVELAGRPAVTPTSGDLSSIAMSRCVAEALAARPVPPGATGSLDYTLTLSGHYDAAPLREDAVLKARWVGFDWSSADGQVPLAVGATLEALREPIRRCAFGAAPELEESRWLVMRVGVGGALTLDVRGTAPGGAPEDAATACVRRALGAASFPDAGHDYALSAYLSPQGSPRPTGDPQHAPLGQLRDGSDFGMIGLLNVGAGGDPDAPSVPWGQEDSADDGAESDRWTRALQANRYGLGLPDLVERAQGKAIELEPKESMWHDAGSRATQPARASTVGGKPLSTVALADVEKRLADRPVDVAALPGYPEGKSPMVFVRDLGAIYALTLSDAPAGVASQRCAVAAEGRALAVRGLGCERVLRAVLD